VNDDYARRVRGGVIALGVFVALGLAVLLASTVGLTRGPTGDPRVTRAVDFVEQMEKRFGPLREVLPFDAEVGYATDEPELPETRYTATQYVLAPVIVRNTPDAQLVVGDFIDPGHARAFISREDLVVVRDLGRGAFLFERKAP
jgi:hypothetical protein